MNPCLPTWQQEVQQFAEQQDRTKLQQFARVQDQESVRESTQGFAQESRIHRRHR